MWRSGASVVFFGSVSTPFKHTTHDKFKNGFDVRIYYIKCASPQLPTMHPHTHTHTFKNRKLNGIDLYFAIHADTLNIVREKISNISYNKIYEKNKN